MNPAPAPWRIHMGCREIVGLDGEPTYVPTGIDMYG